MDLAKFSINHISNQFEIEIRPSTSYLGGKQNTTSSMVTESIEQISERIPGLTRILDNVLEFDASNYSIEIIGMPEITNGVQLSTMEYKITILIRAIPDIL